MADLVTGPTTAAVTGTATGSATAGPRRADDGTAVGRVDGRGDGPGDGLVVLLVDDDPLVRSALRMMLGGSPGIAALVEAEDGDQVPAAVAAHRPDVVLMDLRMARVDGLTATAALRGVPGAPPVLVLTTFDSDEEVVAALRAGAAGFLLKDTPPAQLVAAVRAVAAGEPSVSPSVLRLLVRTVAGGGPDGPAPAAGGSDDPAAGRRGHARRVLGGLSERELDVARAVGRGLANAEVAGELHLSTATVKAHVTRIMQQMGVGNRVQVALLVHDADLPPA